MRKKIITILSLVGVGLVGRLAPHLPNTTPVTGITLAARKYVGAVWAYLIPLIVMLITDSIIGFYDWRVMVSVYGSFIAIGYLSRYIERFPKAWGIVGISVASSLVFFIVTNFAVWAFSPFYAKSLTGLLYCYTLGLPFLRNTLLGDVTYTALLFGLLAPQRTYALLERRLVGLTQALERDHERSAA